MNNNVENTQNDDQNNVENLAHEQLRELLGAYAVHALHEDEMHVVETHLDSCDECQHEMEMLLDTAASLAIMSHDDEKRFAPDLRMDARIRNAVHALPNTIVSDDIDATDASTSNVIPLTTPAPVTRDSVPQDSVTRVAPQANPNSSAAAFGKPGAASFTATKRPRWKIVAASAAAATVIAIPIGLSLASGGGGTSIAALAAKAAKASGSRTISLSNGEKNEVANVVLSPDGQAYLRNISLAALDDSKTYQLWAIVDDTPVSIGVLGASPKTVAITTAGNPQALAISIENKGGAVRPSTPIASGAVT